VNDLSHFVRQVSFLEMIKKSANDVVSFSEIVRFQFEKALESSCETLFSFPKQ
jgi:hypothetical protein